MNYIVKEQDLKDIADSIREKTNSVENLTFPNDFINAIGSINTSKETTGTRIKQGTFTVDTAVAQGMVIEHGAPTTPYIGLIIADNFNEIVGILGYTFLGAISKEYSNNTAFATGYNSNLRMISNMYTVTVNDTNIELINNTTSYYLRPECKYRWMVWY